MVTPFGLDSPIQVDHKQGSEYLPVYVYTYGCDNDLVGVFGGGPGHFWFSTLDKHNIKREKEKNIRTITTCNKHGVKDKNFIVDGFQPKPEEEKQRMKIVCIGCNQEKYLEHIA